MSEEKFKFRIDKSVFFLNIRILLTLVIFFTLSAIMIFDVIRLQNFVIQRTKKFAQDLTLQHAANISKEFTTKMLNMNMIADSLLQREFSSSSKELEEFLQRKAALSVFHELYFIGAEDIPAEIDQNIIHFHQHHLQHPHTNTLHNVHGEAHSCIAYDGISNVYYTQQIIKGGKNLGVLIGMRNRNDLQDFIQLRALNNETVSCIVDKNNQVVVAPTNRHLPPGRNLDDFVLFKETNENNTIIQEIKNDIAQLQSGIGIVKTIKNNRNILITYTPLGINDWVLATFIPEDLITVGSRSYFTRTFIIASIAICAFGIITITAFVSYKKNKRQMELIAFHDSVTGGLNNEGFQLRFREIVYNARANHYAIVLINLKNFKLINEQFGKKEGDRIIEHIHKAIQDSLKNNEFTGRFSADRFFICLHEHEYSVIEKRLKEIIKQVNSLNSNKGRHYLLEFYCGIKIVDKPQQEVIHIQDHARQACSLAMQENNFCVLYKKSFTEKLLKEQEINLLFDDSIKNGDFKLYLQPKVHLETGKVCGAEALVRWIHPEKGIIYPSDFVPLFEANGKICQLDVHMFEQVCNVLNRWKQENRPLIPISINLSRQHYFRNPEFLDTFASLAKKYDIPAGVIDFELTESIFFDTDKFDMVKGSIEEMHNLGFLCSLDDFGIGFSSLGLLKEFDIDTIKFDRQFFLDVSTKKSKTILESLMGMSEKLGIKTVAEGIETHEQLTYLNGTSCDMIQGYIFSAPLEVSEFEVWLDSLENRKPKIQKIKPK